MSFKTKIIFFGALMFHFLPWASYASKTIKPIEHDVVIQNAVLVYINEYRHQHRLPPLKMDQRIVIQAKQHSQDMASHRMSFGHKEFGRRFARLRSQIENTRAGAENVAYNYKNAREVVRQWVRSPGHRRNIVGHYNLTGIGVARDQRGKLYYTQIFLKRTLTKSLQ